MNARKRLGELLVEAKKLTKDQLRKALTDQSEKGGKLGEHLVSLGFINEETLYLTLSKQLKIPVIPEEKLSRMAISPETIALIPRHFAEKNLVLPIQSDKERTSVSVAMVDPNDAEALREIKIICQTEKVKRYLAQRSSILQAINQYYGGAAGARPSEETSRTPTTRPAPKKPETKHYDETTSTSHRQGRPGAKAAEEVSAYEISFETTINPEMAAEMIAEELLEDNTAITSGKPPPPPPVQKKERTETASLARIALEKKPLSEIQREPTSPGLRNSNPGLRLDPRPAAPARSRDDSAPSRPPVHLTPPSEHRILLVDDKSGSLSAAEKVLLSEGYQVTLASQLAEAQQCLKTSTFDLVLLKSTLASGGEALQNLLSNNNPHGQVRIYRSLAKSLLGPPMSYEALSETYFDTVDYLVSLIERNRPDLRSYAHTVAKYSRLVAQRLNLPRLVVDEVYLAAYLQDLWKYFHENPQEAEGSQERRSLVDILEDERCPYRVAIIIKHMSEFYNGTGKPDGLKEEAIPLGARIISVVRAFEEMLRADLVTGAADASKVSKLLRKGAGKKFDPKCVEAFLQVLEGESFLTTVGVQPIADSRNEVLLVDKDPETTSLLELRLINEGFTVHVVRDGQQAWQIIEKNPPALIISDVVLPKIDGFNLCEMVKSNDRTKHVPFIFVSSRTDDFNMTKGLEMGADDYQTKPVNAPFLITKVRKLLESRPAPSQAPTTPSSGVSGNLSQMGLVEIIQILGGGSKTAFIELKSRSGQNAEFFMERGRIVAAACGGKKGEEAFYEIMTWNEGSFSIQSDKTTSERNVNNSTDFLLLEAMRRMDEAVAGERAAT